MSADTMKKRWLELWYSLGLEGNPYKYYYELERLYSEPHRAYHVMKHISDSLDELVAVEYLAQFEHLNFTAIALALWYHDAIYDPRGAANEKMSAWLANKMMRENGLSPEFRLLVTKLIMATKHDKEPDEPNARLLVDIDLSILGQPEERYDEYEREIRKEYDWVPENVFLERRRALFQRFLSRPTIYSTSYFRKKYEAKARANMARTLAKNTAKAV